MAVRTAINVSIVKPHPEVRQLSLAEWETVEHFLTPREAADLLRCPADVLSIQRLTTGAYRLQARAVVGRLQLGSIALALQPKCPIPSLFFMLVEALDLARLLPRMASYQGTPDVIELLVQMYLNEVDRVLRQGLKRTYVGCEAELSAVRGRIAFRETAQLHLRGKAAAYCRYEDYTLDGPENRILAAALETVAGSAAVRAAQRRLAHRLAAEFPGVTPEAKVPTNAPSADRLVQHYQGALQLARLILAAEGILPELGLTRASGLLINMNQLFEQFLSRCLKRVLKPQLVEVIAQQSFPFDLAGQATIRPDLLFRSQSGRRVVADVKYKLDANRSDLYQLLAYCRVLRIRKGLLLCIGRNPARHFQVRDGETTISVLSVDVGGNCEELSRSVMRLADNVVRAVTSNPQVLHTKAKAPDNS